MKGETLHPLSWIQRAAFRIGARLDVDGFDARIFLPHSDHRSRVQALLREALALIQHHAPMRHEYLKRDFDHIFVGATHNVAECHHQIALCLLNYEVLTDPRTTAEAVAVILVHEGTHARLAQAGFRYDRATRARHERVCLMAEAIVARRFSVPTEYERAVERLQQWSPEDWSDDAFRQRRQAALEKLGPEGRLGVLLGRALAWWARRSRTRAV